MKNIECVACGATKIKQTDTSLENGRYILMECCACGLKFLLSENFDVLDDDSYWDDVNKKIYGMGSVLKEFKKKHKKYLNIINRLSLPNNRLLDVGSGNGIFINNAKQHGLDVTGVEPNKIAVELSKKIYGLSPILGYLEMNSNLPKDFGVVTAWDVIEHVANPKEFLTICHAHLNKGGVLILETPDESSFIRKFINVIDSIKKALKFGRLSNIYYSAHRYYFTHQSFEILLNDVGFENIKIYREHSIYSKAIAKIQLYGELSNFKMLKYYLIFFILKNPLFWNKQVVFCTKK